MCVGLVHLEYVLLDCLAELVLPVLVQLLHLLVLHCLLVLGRVCIDVKEVTDCLGVAPAVCKVVKACLLRNVILK